MSLHCTLMGRNPISRHHALVGAVLGWDFIRTYTALISTLTLPFFSHRRFLWLRHFLFCSFPPRWSGSSVDLGLDGIHKIV